MLTISSYPGVNVAAWGAVLVIGTTNSTGDDLFIRVELKDAAGVELLSTFYVPVYGNAFRVDAAAAIRPFLKSPIDVWPTTITPGNAAKMFRLVFTEIYQVAGVITAGDSFIGEQFVAHRAVDIAGRILTEAANSLSLQDGVSKRTVPDNTYLPLDVINIATGLLLTSEDEVIPVTNNRGCSFEPLSFEVFINYFAYIDGTARKTQPIRYFVDTKCYPNNHVVYWLNRFGGYEVYHFIESESISTDGEAIVFENVTWGGTIKQHKIPTQNAERVVLIGRDETVESAAYLRDLATSPEVFLSDGTPVLVAGASIQLYGEGSFRPSITIIKNKTQCIGY